MLTPRHDEFGLAARKTNAKPQALAAVKQALAPLDTVQRILAASAWAPEYRRALAEYARVVFDQDTRMKAKELDREFAQFATEQRAALLQEVIPLLLAGLIRIDQQLNASGVIKAYGPSAVRALKRLFAQQMLHAMPSLASEEAEALVTAFLASIPEE